MPLGTTGRAAQAELLAALAGELDDPLEVLLEPDDSDFDCGFESDFDSVFADDVESEDSPDEPDREFRPDRASARLSVR
jgi:hypothetical protein